VPVPAALLTVTWPPDCFMKPKIAPSPNPAPLAPPLATKVSKIRPRMSVGMPGPLSGKAAIVGIGATDFSKNSGRSELRLASEAVLDALDDAGLTPADVDYVFAAHVFRAQRGGGPESYAERRESFEVNTQAVGRLLSKYRRCRGFVQCSTGSRYEYQGRRPLHEEDPYGVHVGVYSFSKIAAEAGVRVPRGTSTRSGISRRTRRRRSGSAR